MATGDNPFGGFGGFANIQPRPQVVYGNPFAGYAAPKREKRQKVARRKRQEQGQAPQTIVVSAPSNAGKTARRSGGARFLGYGARRSKKGKVSFGRSNDMSFVALSKDWGVQILAGGGEWLAALGATYLDQAAQSTSTTSDDAVVKWGIPALGNFFRGIVVPRWLAKKHPGAGLIVWSMASALSGAVYTRNIERGILAVAKNKSTT